MARHTSNFITKTQLEALYIHMRVSERLEDMSCMYTTHAHTHTPLQNEYVSQPLGLVRVVQHNLFREAELIDQQDQLQVLYIHRSKILHSPQHSLSLSLSRTHTHTHTGTLPSPPDTITKVKDSTNTAKHRRKNRSTFIQALHTYICTITSLIECILYNVIYVLYNVILCWYTCIIMLCYHLSFCVRHWKPLIEISLQNLRILKFNITRLFNWTVSAIL